MVSGMPSITELESLTGDYVIDAGHTWISFVARHTMASGVRGQFDEFAGSARLDGGDPSKSRVALTIQASSIQTGNPRRDAQLRAKFLAVDKYPTITFTSREVRQAGRTSFQVTGDLTIRGVTAPVAVDFELTEAENDRRGNLQVRLVGSAAINRKAWGVRWNAAMGLVSRTVMLELVVTVRPA
jgi:polyisoprenoid-binding protein YceI